MEGGKLLGKGTYGCVFNPPLLCKKKQMPKGSVGKITLDEYFEREKKAYKVLHSIKEGNRYFILANASCTPRIIDNQVDSDIDKCTLFNEEDYGNLKQVSMEFGGKDLSKININSLSFFSIMKHLLEAGSLMVLHGFVHFDISSGNIVVGKNNIPKLIDYGMCFTKDEISLDSIEARWKQLTPKYNAEPPEVTFLTAIDQPNNYSFEEALLEVIPQKPIMRIIEKLLGVPMKKQLSNLASFFKTSQAFHERDIVKLWKLYYPGFDAWNLGVILLQMLNILIFSYEFIESSEWKLKKVIITDILTKMLHTNPKERIDCVEALSMLDPMNEIYLEYGVEWVDARMKQRRSRKV